MKQVKLFRTVTGQDFIGTLAEETDTEYKVEKLLLLAVQPNGDRMQVSFAPVYHPIIGNFDGQMLKAGDVPGAEAPNVTLNKGSIFFVYNPNEEIEHSYSQATSSIQIASSVPNRKHIVDDL